MKKYLLLFSTILLLIPGSILAQYSNASFSGPWIVISQYDAYLIPDGSGTIVQLGEANDTSNPAGTYSVSSAGVLSGSLNLIGGPGILNGNLLNDTVGTFTVNFVDGPFTMLKVPDISVLAGTWSGYIFDSTAGVRRNIQITVSDSGAILSATGISLVAGNIFEVRDTFAGYMSTTDNSCSWQQVQITGLYGGDSLYGVVVLGPEKGDTCGHKGTVHLSKIANSLALLNNEINFLVYPNPFASQIEITINRSYHNLRMDLTDLCGRKLYSNELAGAQNITLPLAALVSGMYLVVLNADGKTFTRFVVKN